MKFSGRVLHKTNLVFSLEPLVLEDLGQGGSFALPMSKAMFTLCMCGVIGVKQKMLSRPQ